MTSLVDASTLRRAAAAQPAALDKLARALQPHIERQLMRYPLSDEDRRDATQATLMQVVRRIGSFRGEASLSTWLFRVTANEALMMLRSQRRHRGRFALGLDLEELGDLPSANDDAVVMDDPSRVSTVRERDARLQAAINSLPEGYRDVVALHYHQDLGLHEIAARLGATEASVRSRLHRARSRLRELLQGDASSVQVAAA